MLFEADYAKNYASIMYQCLVGVRGHRNLNFTECSVIACCRNFNAPKICKITVTRTDCSTKLAFLHRQNPPEPFPSTRRQEQPLAREGPGSRLIQRLQSLLFSSARTFKDCPISIQYSVSWRPTSSLSPCATSSHLFARQCNRYQK